MSGAPNSQWKRRTSFLVVLLICIIALPLTASAQDFIRDTRIGVHDVPLNDPNALFLRYWQVTGDLPSPHSFIIRPVNGSFFLEWPADIEFDRSPSWLRPRQRRAFKRDRRAAIRELEERRVIYRNQLAVYESLNLQPASGVRGYLYPHRSFSFDPEVQQSGIVSESGRERRSRSTVTGQPSASATESSPQGGFPVYAQLHQVRTTSVYNTHLPHGNNLEAIFPAKGLTTLWSATVSFGAGPLHIRLDPTFLYAQSLSYRTYPLDYPDFIWRLSYNNLFNQIDRPFRYREFPYYRVIPGDSEVALRFGRLAVAGSTSNIWWGPGYRNSLLMTNNAEGFAHATIRTERPLDTWLGGVGFQAIWGRLEASGADHRPPRRFNNNLPMPYVERPDDWRLLSGLALTLQPRWAPGLTIGAGRTITANTSDVKRWDQALFSFLRSGYEPFPEDPAKRMVADTTHRYDDKIALYIRFVAPSEQLEVYGEWGRNARPDSWTDFMEFPEHSAGWVLGMNKFFPLRRPLQYIRVGAEFTQLEKTNTWRVRHYPTWYVHPVVRHGYTNRGQLLGAGIGPGSNSQYIGADFLWRANRIGAFFERTIYNNDLYYVLFTTSPLRHWVELSFGLDASWNWRRMTFGANVTVINSLNHMYIEETTVPFRYEGYDPWNLHTSVNIRYRF